MSLYDILLNVLKSFSMSGISWLAIRLYSQLIRLYPAPFRAQFGTEMTAVFAEAISEATGANRHSLLLFFLRELRDYPFSLLREHWCNFANLEPNLMTIIKKPEWFFYPAWIILPLLCVPAVLVLYLVIIPVIIYFAGDIIYVNGVRHITEDYLLDYFFVPVFALLIGSLQYGLLRRYLPRMGWWMPATLLGYSLGILLTLGWRWALIYLGTAEPFYESWTKNMSFILLGFSIGVSQWLLLRRRLPRAGWWIIANIVGWGLLALIIGETLGMFGFIVLGTLPASATAVTLALLMNQLAQPEPQYV